MLRAAALHQRIEEEEGLLGRAASITLRAPQTGLMQAGIVQATTT